MKDFNNYINLGLLFNCIFILGNRTNILPEFIKGLCLGLGLILICIGMYSENHNISSIRNYKKALYSKIFANRN